MSAFLGVITVLFNLYKLTTQLSQYERQINTPSNLTRI